MVPWRLARSRRTHRRHDEAGLVPVNCCDTFSTSGFVSCITFLHNAPYDAMLSSLKQRCCRVVHRLSPLLRRICLVSSTTAEAETIDESFMRRVPGEKLAMHHCIVLDDNYECQLSSYNNILAQLLSRRVGSSLTLVWQILFPPLLFFFPPMKCVLCIIYVMYLVNKLSLSHLRSRCRVAQLVECLVTSGYPDGSSSGGPSLATLAREDWKSGKAHILQSRSTTVQR